MNKWILLFAIITALNLPGCSMFDTKKDIAVTPTLAATPVAVPAPTVKTVTPTVEEKTLVQGVPDIKQAQVIGVIRELRKGGCVVKQYARTSGIHYKQLVVTCGDPEKAPAIAIP